MSIASKLSLFASDLSISGVSFPESDGTIGQVITTDGNGILSFANIAYSSLTGAPNVLDSADVIAISSGGGGGGLDSAAAINIIDNKILQLDIGDIVGTDGNPGEVLQSNGNGNSSWTDIKLIAKQKAFAMSLIFD